MMFYHWTFLDSVIIYIEVKNTTETQKSASYLDLHIEIDNGGRLKKNSTTNTMTSLFQLSTSLLSGAIFQHHQRMEFKFHNSYVILELVSSTVIFWTEHGCWHKSYSNKATLFLSWSHRYKNFTVVITILLSYEMSISEMTMDLLFSTYIVFFTLSLPKLWLDLTVPMSNTVTVL